MPDDKPSSPEPTRPDTVGPPRKDDDKPLLPTRGDPGVRSPKFQAGPETEGSDQRAQRKLREGEVTSDSMDKTAVVTVVTRKPHPRYKKTMARTTRLYVHDEENTLRVGDRVKVAETRPLSKLKRWRIVEILERAK